MTAITDSAPTPGRRPSVLYVLCFEHLPEHQKTEGRNSVLDVPRIAKEIGVTKQKVWLWLKENAIPAHRMFQFCELAGSKLTPEILKPFTTVGMKPRKKS